MSLTMNLKHTSQIDSLIQRFPCFSGLKNKQLWEYDEDALKGFFDGYREDVPKDTRYRWDVPQMSFFDYQEQVSVLPAMFIGKTGYGKSSLLNYIIGKSVFPIDDIKVCTREIDAALFRLGANPLYYLALCDLPGVGENEQADKLYMDWYSEMIECSPSVIYVLRADQRDFSIDERAFERLFQSEDDLNKVIVALNCADKIEPINRGVGISEAQMEALEVKQEKIAEIFSVESYRIFPCCAHNGYGIEELVTEMMDDLELCTFDID